MTDTQSIVDSMTALTDDEVRAVVAAVTTARPALAAVRAAALDIQVFPAPVAPPGAAPGAVAVPATDTAAVPDPGSVSGAAGYTGTGVPTFDAVREKIETRAGTAEGAAELDDASESGRTLQEQYAAREKAAQDRLAEIRRSLRHD